MNELNSSRIGSGSPLVCETCGQSDCLKFMGGC